MLSACIYLDESGDLGWSFDKPYRNGGSSRYLTIASLVSSSHKNHLPSRMMKRLYQKHRWDSQKEKKWSQMSGRERVSFANKAANLFEANKEEISYLSITVRKENVQPHIRRDPNKLYNYMIGLSLIQLMSRYSVVRFYPDPRSIKVESGNSLHDYLQTQLWFDRGAETNLTTIPMDSSASRNIQFADMISGVVQGHFEDGNSRCWEILNKHISYKTLFF